MAKRASGEGSPRQRADGRWEVRFWVEDPSTGKRRRLSAYGQRRKDAMDKMDSTLERLRKGGPVKDSTATVGHWVTQWVQTTLQASDVAESYKESSAYNAKHLTRGAFGQLSLSKLKPTHIEELIVHLRQPVQSADEQRDGLAPATIKSVLIVLRKSLDTAVRDKMIAENPARKIPTPRIPQGKPKSIPEDDVRRLLEALSKSRYYAAFVTLSVTGVRRGEVLGLTWSSINWRTKKATISQTVQAAKGGPRLKPVPKSSHSYREVPLPGHTLELLRAWQKVQVEERLAAGGDWESTDLVFTAPTGGPVHPRNFLRVLQTAADRTGVKGATIHAFRHSAASTLLDDGVNVRAVRDLLGHSTAQITLDVYGHTLDDTSRQAAASLEERFVLAPGGRTDKGEETASRLRSV